MKLICRDDLKIIHESIRTNFCFVLYLEGWRKSSGETVCVENCDAKNGFWCVWLKATMRNNQFDWNKRDHEDSFFI